ncbi:MAG TPA: hypothetical protein VGB18_00280 [Candidatus Thermoplasmatota archaeon]
MRVAEMIGLLIPFTAMAGCSVCDFASGCTTVFGVNAIRDYEGGATVDEVAGALEKMGYDVVSRDVSFVQASAQDPLLSVYVRGFSPAPGPVGYEPPADGELRLCISYLEWNQFREMDAAHARGNELRAQYETHAKSFAQQLEANADLTPTTGMMWETATYKEDVERTILC